VNATVSPMLCTPWTRLEIGSTAGKPIVKMTGDGYLDPMSVLVVLGLLDEELGNGVALQSARIPDTATLDAMGASYERLRGHR
jgi:hypothetical protein